MSKIELVLATQKTSAAAQSAWSSAMAALYAAETEFDLAREALFAEPQYDPDQALRRLTERYDVAGIALDAARDQFNTAGAALDAAAVAGALAWFEVEEEIKAGVTV